MKQPSASAVAFSKQRYNHFLLLVAGLLFHNAEKSRVDVKDALQAMVTSDQKFSLAFDEAAVVNLLDCKSDATQLQPK